MKALSTLLLSTILSAASLLPAAHALTDHPCLNAEAADYQTCLVLFGVDTEHLYGQTLSLSEEKAEQLCNVYPEPQQASCMQYFTHMYPRLLQTLAPLRYDDVEQEQEREVAREEPQRQTEQAELLWMLCADSSLPQNRCYQRLLPTILRRSVSTNQMEALVRRIGN